MSRGGILPLAFAAASLCLGQQGQTAYTIRTVAGEGIRLGDGGPAMAAQFFSPCGMAMDRQGNLYVADRDNFRVRMISPSGTITTFAGAGGYGFGGDGGPALTAQFQEVSGLAMDSAGNLYVADYFNHRIRKITPAGIISTYAGSAADGYDGDGGAATRAKLQHPVDIALDAAGNLYIADRSNNRVRKVSTDGIITTIAGSGQAGFSGDGGPATLARLNRPQAVAVDTSGNVFVSDQNNFRVRRISPTGTITTVAGTGDRREGPPGPSATQTNLNLPRGLVTDSAGNLYVADMFVVWKVTPSGGISLFAGGSQDLNSAYLEGVPATSVFIAVPSSLMFDSAGNMYISEEFGQRVRKITADGIIRTVAGASHFYGDGGPATSAGLFEPLAVALDGNGNLYIADAGNQRIRKVTPSGTISTAVSYPDVIVPCGVTVDRSGNLFVPDCGYQQIRKIDSGGRASTYAGDGNDRSGATGPATSAQLELSGSNGIGVAVDDAGNVYFAEDGMHRIRKVTPAGTISTLAGTGQAGFSGDGGAATRALINSPSGLALDKNGNVYFADTGNGRIRMISAGTGMINTVGSPSLSFSGATGVAVNAAGNVLFVSETNRQRIHRMEQGAPTVVIAGDGTGGFAGDGGPALSAKFQYPGQLALDTAGDIYLVDRGNHRVRKLTAVAAPAINSDGVKNAASYEPGEVAADSWVSLFGSNFAEAVTVAGTSAGELPSTLGGVTVKMTDSAGTARTALLHFVTPTQVNFLAPSGTQSGAAHVTLTSAGGLTASATIRVAAVAPGIFSANSSGKGPAAAVALHVAGTGAQTWQYTFSCPAPGACVNAPIDLGAATDQVILQLFGTGLRKFASGVTATIGGQTAEVLGAAAQGQYAGLDQVNIRLSRVLAGRGEVDVVVTVDGKKANTVTVAIR